MWQESKRIKTASGQAIHVDAIVIDRLDRFECLGKRIAKYQIRNVKMTLSVVTSKAVIIKQDTYRKKLRLGCVSFMPYVVLSSPSRT